MTISGGAGQRRRRVRPGMISLVVGLGMVAATVVWTVASSNRSTLGVMFGLVASYAVSASVVFQGVITRRDKDRSEPQPARSVVTDRDAAWVGDLGRRSLRCSLGGHREVFVARTAEHPPMWQCRRCGASSRTHMVGGRG